MTIHDLPVEAVRPLILQSSLALGMYYRPKGLIKPYELNTHMDRHLLRLGHDKVRRQIINVPPQTGKTIGVVHWLVKHLIQNPDKRAMYISYNDDRAGTIGVDAKNCFQKIGGMFGYSIDPSLKKKTEWRINGHEGGLLCCGRGGTITGNPADIIVFDDPYKNHEEATSIACLAEVKNLWDSAIRARLAHDTIVIMIQTRWSPEDITGHVLKQERQGLEKWSKLIVPALPERDIYDSYGELICKADGYCPSRKPREMFEKEKKTISEYFWNALYQQRPTAMEGNIWSECFTSTECFVDQFPADVKNLVIAVDPAVTGLEAARADYTAIVANGTTGDGKFYVDADIRRCSPEQAIDRLISMILKMPRQPDLVGIESLGFQEYVKDIAAQRMIDAGIHCPVIGLEPLLIDRDNQRSYRVGKMERIVTTLDPWVRADSFRFVRSSAGCALLVSQLETVPRIGKKIHDDGPDALEMTMRLLEEVQLEKTRLTEIASR